MRGGAELRGLCLVGYVVFPGFDVMSFGAMSVFEADNASAGTPRYDLRLLSETGGPFEARPGRRADGYLQGRRV